MKGRAVSPINGQPLPRGKPFTSESGRKARQTYLAKRAAETSIADQFKKLVLEIQTDKNGKEMTGAEIIARSLMKSCLAGNVRAQELALALMGEKPAEKVMISTPDSETIEKVEDALFGGDRA